jgi:hypothetical protein
MGRRIHSMNVSLDGFIATPDAGLDWVLMDRELHEQFNDEARATAAFLYERGL